jgi:cytochrome c553
MKVYIGLIAGALLMGLSMSGCSNDGRTEFKNLSKAPAADPSINARALFVDKCMKCHGENGTTHPLAVPYVIAGQPKELLIAKIEGYKALTFGGPLRGQMATSVQLLTPKEVNALADYISKL